MDKPRLKKFAQYARRSLIEHVSTKLFRALEKDSIERRELPDVVSKLEEKLNDIGKEQLIEQVAYIWFNRFCSLRYMDAKSYNRIQVLSPIEGQFQPEILAEAKSGHLNEAMIQNALVRERIAGLLSGSVKSLDPQAEAYRLLVVSVCNSYHRSMPFMFEQIQDFTELLMPDDLLSGNSILAYTREAMTPENCEAVEVIGWLYQFYISEKKDDVFAALKKGKKITAENIPAATQLFTPHWIVRYLVENSLGRLWMLNHPESTLVEQMDYYIKPEEPETDFLRIEKPEDIKISDPACGSGHMLTYAFDLMYAIYEEQGYPKNDIPQLILTHNLYGIEIDPRAGALAAFALTMKAREKYHRFLSSGKAVQPNICVLENIHIQPEELSAYMDKVGLDLLTTDLQEVMTQWEEVDNFGSLIRPAVTDVSEVMELLRVREVDQDLLLAVVHHKVLKALKQADYLSPKYHVVVANPPYMGQKGMTIHIKQFLKENYNEVKSDLFSAFILRNFDLALPNGQLGFMTPFVWMFLSTYQPLRQQLIKENTLTSLIQLEYSSFDGATVPICTFTAQKNIDTSFNGAYVRLSDFRGSDLQGPKVLEAISNPACGWFYRAKAADFNHIPGSPIAYWASKSELAAFSNNPPLGEKYEARVGLQSNDNERFLRLWFEVSLGKIGFSCLSEEKAEELGRKWFPYHKGGAFRRWYGNHEYVINWENNGREVVKLATDIYKSPTRTVRSRDFYFQKGFTYSTLSSGMFAARINPGGFMFDIKGSCIFPKNKSKPDKAVLAVLNSSTVTNLLALTSPTLDFSTGAIEAIPIPTLDDDVANNLRDIVDSSIELARIDWDLHETSWEFKGNALLQAQSGSIRESLGRYQEFSFKNTSKIAQMQSTLDSLVSEAFGIDSSQVLNETQLQSGRTNPAGTVADSVRELISYAVGCMFGRYSLDKHGLVLANQGDTVDNYYQLIPEPTFRPDEENVIPLLDGDWFTDDISERFKNFLKVTFGVLDFEENLTCLENALYPDNVTGTKRKTIRDYFLKEFYSHHVRLYKKRPVYWLFSSPKGTFNALIYIHRYRPDTVSVVLNSYLRELQTKLQAKKESLEQVGISATASPKEKTQALKEINKLNTMLTELKDYERDVLYPLATQNIEIDLDDGVKVNYPKFGKALKKVTGLS